MTLSLVLTWLHNGSVGSVLLAVLMHGVVNGSYEAFVGGLAPVALEGFLAPVTVLFAVIATVTLRRRRRGLAAGGSRSP